MDEHSGELPHGSKYYHYFIFLSADSRIPVTAIICHIFKSPISKLCPSTDRTTKEVFLLRFQLQKDILLNFKKISPKHYYSSKISHFFNATFSYKISHNSHSQIFLKSPSPKFFPPFFESSVIFRKYLNNFSGIFSQLLKNVLKNFPKFP